MRHTDVVIAGGGLAGSLAAAMLGRAGIDAVLVDPHPVYPPDFRCEKLDRIQLQTLGLTGLADAVMRASTPDQEAWVARYGRLVDKVPGARSAAFSTTRWSIPCARKFRPAPRSSRPRSPISRPGRTGRPSSCRTARRFPRASSFWRPASTSACCKSSASTREIISPGHSISIGFDIEPAGRTAFAFSALTYFTERPATGWRTSRCSRSAAAMRVNLFVYRDLHDPWLKQFREAPQDTLFAMWPGCAS